jgi:hypothetical protein
VLAAFSLRGAPAVRRSGVGRPRARLAAAIRHPAVLPVIVVAEGYLALSATRNQGTGFVVPLLPALVALAVLAAWRLPWRQLRAALVAAFAVVSAFNVVMKANVVDPLSAEVELSGATVMNGQGYLHQHLDEVGGYPVAAGTRPLPDGYERWLDVEESVASYVVQAAAQQGTPAQLNLATNDPIVNPNALALAGQRVARRDPSAPPLAPASIPSDRGATPRAYGGYLGAATPKFLLTMDAEPRQFGPPVDQDAVERAAQGLGFAVVRRFRAPTGELRVWGCCEPQQLAEGRRRLGLG